jgi:hypothetical protein
LLLGAATYVLEKKGSISFLKKRNGGLNRSAQCL